jgi:hypothetical protein
VPLLNQVFSGRSKNSTPRVFKSWISHRHGARRRQQDDIEDSGYWGLSQLTTKVDSKFSPLTTVEKTVVPVASQEELLRVSNSGSRTVDEVR